jgi:hypothetical protein
MLIGSAISTLFAFLLYFEPQDYTDLHEKTVEDARCKTCSLYLSLFYLLRLKTLSGQFSSFLVLMDITNLR